MVAFQSALQKMDHEYIPKTVSSVQDFMISRNLSPITQEDMRADMVTPGGAVPSPETQLHNRGGQVYLFRRTILKDWDR